MPRVVGLVETQPKKFQKGTILAIEGTSEGVGLNQDLCGSGSKSGTSEQVYQSQRPLQDQVQARDLQTSGPRPGAFTETELSQQPVLEQA